MASKHPELLDTKDLMKMLCVSRNTVLAFCNEGAIPAFKIGSRWYSTVKFMQEHFENALNKTKVMSYE